MSSTLPVVETFHSLQGEGAHVGKSAFFIRLAKCRVGCLWCDTKNSWQSNNHPEKSVKALAKEAAKATLQGARFIVLTGGEPLHHNLDELSYAIRSTVCLQAKELIPIHLETSGVDNLSGTPNWITLSPKPHAPPTKEILGSCNELKVIIHDKNDLQFAEEMAKATVEESHDIKSSNKFKMNLSKQPLLFLQPGWDSKEGKYLAFEYVRKHPKWRLSLQTHKWLGIQ